MAQCQGRWAQSSASGPNGSSGCLWEELDVVVHTSEDGATEGKVILHLLDLWHKLALVIHTTELWSSKNQLAGLFLFHWGVAVGGLNPSEHGCLLDQVTVELLGDFRVVIGTLGNVDGSIDLLNLRFPVWPGAILV